MKKTKEKKRGDILRGSFMHPVLFAIFPTIVLYSYNINEAGLGIMVAPLLYSIFFAILSWLLFFAVLRNVIKTSIATSVWLILFFSYGHLYLFLGAQNIFKILPFGPNVFLLMIYFLIFVAFSFFLLRTRTKLVVFTRLLNFVGIVLISINLINIIPFDMKRAIELGKLKAYKEEHKERVIVKNTDKSTYPDIYYFIFDRYGNHRILKKYFNYNNRQFLNFLREKGFFIGEKSFANYPSTFLSLTSSLNMEYINFLKDVLGKDYSDETVVYSQLLTENKVVEFLKERGYRYIHVGDVWEGTKSNKLADENYNKFIRFDEFQLYLYENTLLNTLLGKVLSQRVYSGVERLNKIIENMDYRIQKIKERVPAKGPKFVFGHFLLPHPPYLFSDTCSPLDFKIVQKRSEEEGYIRQTNCANKKIIALVDEITKKSQRPSVIIVQSDEGPFLPYYYFNREKYPKKFSKDPYLIHAYILNTFYLPDKGNWSKNVDYSSLGLYNTFTPVNTFRLIFNYYFGTNFKFLEDRIFIFKDDKYPYNLTEITSIIKNKNQ